MKEHHGLAKQFIRIIALAALESVLLLTVSQVVLAKGLRFWFSRTEVQQHATQKQVQELQSYVTEHHLASTDVKELTDWLDGRYPADMAEHWDNVGLLVGDDEAEVHHVLLAQIGRAHV